MSEEVLAVVTARGGSRRIPRKSIALLAGRPLIAHVVAAVRVATRVSRVIVDTDDPEMAEVARAAGAEVPFLRPAELAGDGVGHVAVLSHALESLRRLDGYRPHVVVLIQPTSPFVRPDQIDAAVELLQSSGVDSVETVTELPTVCHPYNVRVIGDDGLTRFLLPEERARALKEGRRPVMYSIGNLYAFRPQNLTDTGTIQGARSRSIVIDRRSALDVDEPIDLLVAEALVDHQI